MKKIGFALEECQSTKNIKVGALIRAGLNEFWEATTILIW